MFAHEGEGFVDCKPMLVHSHARCDAMAAHIGTSSKECKLTDRENLCLFVTGVAPQAPTVTELLSL